MTGRQRTLRVMAVAGTLAALSLAATAWGNPLPPCPHACVTITARVLPRTEVEYLPLPDRLGPAWVPRELGILRVRTNADGLTLRDGQGREYPVPSGESSFLVMGGWTLVPR